MALQLSLRLMILILFFFSRFISYRVRAYEHAQLREDFSVVNSNSKYGVFFDNDNDNDHVEKLFSSVDITTDYDQDGDGIPDEADEDPEDGKKLKFPVMLDVWKALRLSNLSYRWFTDASLAELGPYKEQTKLTAEYTQFDEHEEMLTDWFGKDVELSADGLTMVVTSVGDTREVSDSPDSWVRTLLVYSRPSLKSTQWTERARIHSPPGTVPEDEFASDVDISGDGNTIVTSAWHHEGKDGTVKGGIVWVFSKVNKNKVSWKQNYSTRKLWASDPMREDYFGSSVAVSHDGNVIAVGSFLVDVYKKHDDNGAVYIFVRTARDSPSSSFREVQKLSPSDVNTEYGYFGEGVAMSSDASTIIVGASGTDIEGRDFGAAYVFINKGGNGRYSYTESSKLIHNDDFQKRDEEDWNGGKVSISADGRTILTAAHGYNEGGGAFIFERDGPSLSAPWTQQATIVANDREDGDYYGIWADLSADGTTVVIGAEAENTGKSAAGAAYVHRRKDGEWSQIAKLMPSDKQFGGRNFGRAVSINADGSAIAVGALHDPFIASDLEKIDDYDMSEDAILLREFSDYDRNGAVYMYGLDEGDKGWIRPSRVKDDL